MVNVEGYVNSFLESLDKFVRENINELTGIDLAEFYNGVFKKLKENYFGGSWGFAGVTEFLLYRVLYYIGVEKYNERPRKLEKLSRDLRVTYFTRPRLALSAGRPLILGGTKKWIDIMVYETSEADIANIRRLKSAIEIKAYPQRGIKGLQETVERLKNIHKFYGEPDTKLALVVYNVYATNKQRSKVCKYLLKNPIGDIDPIPDYIDVFIMSQKEGKGNERIKNLLMNYI